MGKPKIKKTKFYCYKITCLVNAKAYVGICSTSIIKRWTQHKHDAKNGAKTPLHSAIRKYGDKTFSIELLALVNNWEDVCRLECEYIVKYNTLAKNKNGYNVSIGGEGPFGVERSIETKKKLSEITKKWLKNDPSRLENLRKKAKKQMEDPINREKSRKGALKQWENEEFRKKFIQHKIEWAEKNKENMRLRSQMQMSNIENRKHLTKLALNQMSKSENREKSREGAFKQWENPEFVASRLGGNHPLSRAVKINGVEYSTIKNAALAIGVATTTIRNRIKVGIKNYTLLGNHGFTERRKIDWIRVEKMYKNTLIPLKKLAIQCHASEAAIRNKANKFYWKRKMAN